MSVGLALAYEEVLKREGDALPITLAEVDELVAFLCANSSQRELSGRFWPLADDPDDEMIARLAVTHGCDFLITHNVRHFRSLDGTGVSVVTPGEFLATIRGGS